MPSFGGGLGAFLAGFPKGLASGTDEGLDQQEKLRQALALKAYGAAAPDIAGLQGIAASGQPSSMGGSGPTPGQQPMGGGPPGVGSYAPPVAPQMGGPPLQPYSVMGGAQPDIPNFGPPSLSPPPGVRPTMPNLTGPAPVYPPRGGPPDPATQQQFMRDNPAFRPPLAPSAPGAASGMPGAQRVPAASGGMQQPQQPLTLERVVQAVTKNNPGIRPDVLAGAVQLATKDMLPFEQLKARQYSLDLRERDFNERVREFEVGLGERKAAAGERRERDIALEQYRERSLDLREKALGADEDVGDRAKAIAEYRQAPITNPRTPQQRATMDQVYKLNSEYDQKTWQSRNKAVTAFSTGPEAQTLKYLQVASGHLDTLMQLSEALENKEPQAINFIRQKANEQLGHDPITNFEAAKSVVASEIVKAIVPKGGGVKDREEARNIFSAIKSPQQLKGAGSTIKSLLATQTKGLKDQYERTTGLKNFDEIFNKASSESGLDTGGGWKVEPVQ